MNVLPLLSQLPHCQTELKPPSFLEDQSCVFRAVASQCCSFPFHCSMKMMSVFHWTSLIVTYIKEPLCFSMPFLSARLFFGHIFRKEILIASLCRKPSFQARPRERRQSDQCSESWQEAGGGRFPGTRRNTKGYCKMTLKVNVIFHSIFTRQCSEQMEFKKENIFLSLLKENKFYRCPIQSPC